jgi:hypothetical protein
MFNLWEFNGEVNAILYWDSLFIYLTLSSKILNSILFFMNLLKPGWREKKDKESTTLNCFTREWTWWMNSNDKRIGRHILLIYCATSWPHPT